MFPMNPKMQFIQQVMQIKRNPNQLAGFLQQKGMINQEQAQAIQKMGGNYEQIGHYLMNQGKMPSNVQQYQNDVNEVQNMMK